MNNSEENKATSLPQPAFVGALANLSTLFHSFSQGRNVRPKGQRESSSQLDAQTQRRTQEAAEKIDTLLRSTARQYQDLEKEAQSLLGGVSLSQVFPGLRKSALSSNSLTGDPESVMAGMAREHLITA